MTWRSAASACLFPLFWCAACTPTQVASPETIPESAVIQTPQTASTSPVTLPFALSIEPHPENGTVDIVITFHTQVTTSPELEIVPAPQTTVDHSPLKTKRSVPIPSSPQTQTRISLAIEGDNPAFNATLRYLENGFGVEVHESYPQTDFSEKKAAAPHNIRKELPAPIDMHGTRITTGVPVKPQTESD